VIRVTARKKPCPLGAKERALYGTNQRTLGILLSCLMVGLVVFLLVVEDKVNGNDPLGRWFAGNVIVLGLWFGLQVTVLPNLWVCEGGLLVRNVFRVWCVPWGAVSRVEMVEADGGVDVHLRDGRSIGVWSLSPSLISRLGGDRRNREAEKVLERRLDQARATEVASPGRRPPRATWTVGPVLVWLVVLLLSWSVVFLLFGSLADPDPQDRKIGPFPVGDSFSISID
jgi:hypothetical protein